MIKHTLCLAGLLACSLMVGCTTNITVEEPASDSENTIQNQESSQSSSSSDSTKTDSEKNSSETSDASQSDASASSSTTQKSGSASEASGQNDPDSRARTAADTLISALQKAGYTVDEPEYETTDTGNAEAILSANVENGVTTIYITCDPDDNSADKTYQANIADQENEDMEIMDSWQSGNTEVCVVRNNMANANFINVFDASKNMAMEICNETPEQLDPMLSVLGSLGYPVSD